MSIPFGITYLGAVLRQHNHEVRLYDVYPDDNLDDIVEELSATFVPDLIGFSVLTTNFCRTKSFASALKKHFHSAYFCAGGIHPTVRPLETIENMDLDFVVIGEGENVLLKACDALENSKGLIGIKGIACRDKNDFYINRELDIAHDLDSLPFPARDLLPVSRYLIPPGYIRSHFLRRVMSVLTSRGCPSKCTFCNSSSIFHNRIRRRSINNVMNEIRHLVDYYHLDGIYFHDETFTMNHEWVESLCSELKPLGLRWGCQTRVTLVNEELLRVMRDAGCIQIDFGIESASRRALKSIKKGSTPELAAKALEMTKKSGIKSFASFMIGLPGETEEDMLEDVKFLKKIKPDFTYFNLFTPFPGTEAAEAAIKEGKLPADYFSRDYDMLLETAPLVNLSAEPIETVIKYHKKLRNMVFFRNYIGVLTRNNLMIISEALFYFLSSPSVMFKSLAELAKNRNVEKFIFTIFSNYQQHKSKETSSV
jgi:radical SAM superfamily enzyme YgiQ (UPF0313 family)